MIKTVVNIKLNLPQISLTAQDMLQTGTEAIALLKMRVYDQNKDLDGKPFKPYSTRPFMVRNGSDTAKRLKPKGGQKRNGGVFYKGGYKEYKASSTGSSDVNLTLSGNLLQSIQVTDANAKSFTISPTGSAKKYALKVDTARPFIGVTNAELEILKEIILQKLFNQGRTP